MASHSGEYDSDDENFRYSKLLSDTKQFLSSQSLGCADRFIPQREPRRWQALTRSHMANSSNGRTTNFASVNDIINMCQGLARTDGDTRNGRNAAAAGAYSSSANYASSAPTSNNTPASQSPNTISGRNNSNNSEESSGGNFQPQLYSRLVASEIFDFADLDLVENSQENNNRDAMILRRQRADGTFPPPLSTPPSLNAVVVNSNSGSGRSASFITPVKRGVLTYSPVRDKPRVSPYSLSPANDRTLMLIKTPQRAVRKIAKAPYKVLDAPDLQDDFYLNLIDWSPQNVLAVGLGSSVYLWNATTSSVTKLCDFSADHTNSVTSVSWNEKGNLLAVGSGRGSVEIWDVHKSQLTNFANEHGNRVGAMAWNGDLLATGSRDRHIFLADIRSMRSSNNGNNTNGGNNSTSHALAATTDVRPSSPFLADTARSYFDDRNSSFSSSTYDNAPALSNANNDNASSFRRLQSHKQEVCGLRWSPDRVHLASGGNDNRLLVWSPVHSLIPVQIYTDHSAAVKAISWSPHHHGLLASGGGTADRTIRFWNTLTQQSLQSVDTGSQVCNIAWSRHTSELVSTHGYSQNQILVWKYPNVQQVAKLTGHTFRVLYLACAPDGESIVTGAGDETLRFWRVFNKPVATDERRSRLDLTASLR